MADDGPAEDEKSKYDLFIDITSSPPEKDLESIPARPLSYDEVASIESSFAESQDDAEAWVIDPMAMDGVTMNVTQGEKELSDDEAVMLFAIQTPSGWIPISFQGNDPFGMTGGPSNWTQLATVEHDEEVNLEEEMFAGSMKRLSDLRR